MSIIKGVMGLDSIFGFLEMTFKNKKFCF